MNFISKISLFSIICLVFSFTSSSPNQTILGKWKTIDDETKKPSSIIEIYEVNGKVHGKLIELLQEGRDENSLCTECSGKRKNQKILGMEILWDLKKESDKEWEDGEILDPNNGKTYSCQVELESNDKLKVRGYIGFSLMGRTQYWYRVK
ncbi:DUF2147 domain-containing protein [Bernardetia sp. Wsw4-3y2]|uniref:DUF2147 domain-containing protein n=1 Tax=Bernardetia sp. Wsw4-3y2 TaxID=3127471 RepID=UPI0030CF0A5B